MQAEKCVSVFFSFLPRRSRASGRQRPDVAKPAKAHCGALAGFPVALAGYSNRSGRASYISLHVLRTPPTSALSFIQS